MDAHLVGEGPWRATRLWNSIVRSLHEGIPRKKHRKHLKTYEDCFTANEAIDWLYRQLKHNPNFDSDVSKEQTLLLLQKLFRAGVIVRIDVDFSSSNSMLAKTPSAMLTHSSDTFKPGNDLYRLAPKSQSVLNTPGKKKEDHQRRNRNDSIRSPLEDLSNTPVSREQSSLEKGGIKRNGLSGLRNSFRKIKNKHRDILAASSNSDDEDEENLIREPVDANERKKLNLSYLQSLPANSLVVLDNDSMWREVFLGLLRIRLSDAHINSLGDNINVSNIIYNMTNVSEKGVVQLHGKKSNDLPRWTLSAMKCLANWPKPFQAMMTNDGIMPNYEGFEVDVFNVVKEYFTSLPIPLTTFELFDIIVSTFIKAEAVSALRDSQQHPPTITRPSTSNFAITPMPYLETDLDCSRPSSTSTPSGYYSGTSGSYKNFGRMLTSQQRTANIRPTMHVMPTTHTAVNYMPRNYPSNLSASMSPTAIMRNFLPPNTCFETAFMNENPITRIVPQKGSDVIHFGGQGHSRPSSRMSSCRPPLSSGTSLRSSQWDSRSIATQTSDEEGDLPRPSREVRRQPRWKRSSRQRKSIAVMETNRETMELTNRFRSSSYSTSALPENEQKMRTSNSMDNILDNASEHEKQFLQRYQQIGDLNARVPARTRRFSMTSLPSANNDQDRRMSPPDNVILSKTVRKEKRKQREKRERSVERLDYRHPSAYQWQESPVSTQSTSSLASSSVCCRQNGESYRNLGHYHHLTVKTPMHICGENAPIPYMDEGMQRARAEPFHEAFESLNAEGRRLAIETYQLLGLLLPPESRRKLQLLMKFMRRVRSKQGLKLSNHPKKSCHDFIVDTFSEAILRPKYDLANYDEELCKRIVCFFMENYDEIWTPPVCLRKEVEERVYQSLVSKRIEAGEDPYPITFCKRVPSKVYEKEKVLGVQAAMLDLLEQILNDNKMGSREKRKKLKKFKAAYPQIYAEKFPTAADEPEILRNSSLSRLKSVMRI